MNGCIPERTRPLADFGRIAAVGEEFNLYGETRKKG